jgi:hypothetical protein
MSLSGFHNRMRKAVPRFQFSGRICIELGFISSLKASMEVF